mgnify:CR=1 FL=1
MRSGAISCIVKVLASVREAGTSLRIAQNGERGVATRRDVKPLRSIGLKYKFFCVLAKLLPVRTLNWLVGLIYAK